MNYQLITDDQSLLDCVTLHSDYKIVAIDTEFRRRDTFFPQPALLQICWSDTAYLIDPLEIRDHSPIVELLTSPQVIKLIHSPSEDLEVFECWLGVLPSPLFDTQRALALLGQGFGMGYRGMVEQYRGIQLNKDETQSDWLRRPLSDQQLLYAVQDVTHLRDIGEELVEACIQRGRFEWVLEDTAKLRPGGRGPLHKFKSAWKLNVADQQLLIDLVDYREREARRIDKPRSWVLPDKVISAIVKAKPNHLGALAKIEGLHDGVVRRRGKRILEIIKSSQPESGAAVRFKPPLMGEQKKLLGLLVEEAQRLAHDMEVAAEALLSKAEVEELVKLWLEKPNQRTLATTGWRDQVIIEPLRSMLDKVVRERSEH